jgi:signal transduction histidine kinase
MDEKMKIMVVDDELIVRESLYNWFRKEGHVVETASSGFEALAKLEKNTFQIMFVDIRMSGMDGLELLEKVKGKYPDTMVVIITAYGSIESAVKAMKTGASDYLLKPFKPDQLSLVMERISYQKKLRSKHNIEKVMMQQEKLASIGRLSAGVAHEINNPLTTILTSVMLIQEEFCPDQSVCGDLQIVIGEALRCRRIVSSLLDFARRTTPTKKSCNINNIVNECITLTQKQAAFNDVKLEAELSERLPPIHVDKDQIQQALINLALNAIDVTNAGGVVTFTTVYIPEEHMIAITVSDTGEGISDENLNRVFDPFFTTKENGTGLGLAVTHGIIEQHNGTIEVNSISGQGTYFSIRLPIDQGVYNA